MRGQAIQIKQSNFRGFWVLCKPRVVALMLVTTYVGMFLAASDPLPLPLLLATLTGVALCAGAAASINHIIDHRIDRLMKRTNKRPIVSGAISIRSASIFALLMMSAGFLILASFVNQLTAFLTLATLIGYAGIYTIYLKHTTAQNIVIGGLSGAFPPLLGWTAVSGTFQPNSLLLVLIIYTWTPPHFWALALHRLDEYKKAKIPMLPVTHGVSYTKLCIFLYSILLFVCTLLPYLVGMSHVLYLFGCILLNIVFNYWAIRLLFSDAPKVSLNLFRYSILYLLLLFILLLIDKQWVLNFT